MPCVNAARTKVVPCDSAEAAYRYKAEDLKALGLSAPADAKAVAPVEDKAVAPAEDKAVAPTASKAK